MLRAILIGLIGIYLIVLVFILMNMLSSKLFLRTEYRFKDYKLAFLWFIAIMTDKGRFDLYVLLNPNLKGRKK